MSLEVSRNKWIKHLFMKGSVKLAPHLPKTRRMTRSSFWKLMAQYGRVIVKPIGGSRGRGVIQVSAIGNGRYKIQEENRKIKKSGKGRTYDHVKRLAGPHGYLVQRKIHRARVNGRPFDTRVIVQRKRKSDTWKVTGKVAKVAGKGYIVSNIERSKGTVLPVRTAIKLSTLKGRSSTILKKKLDKVAILSAKRLRVLFPGHRIYGLDLALDHKGRVWIIEANLFPSRSHFLKLKDKSMYNRITRYKHK